MGDIRFLSVESGRYGTYTACYFHKPVQNRSGESLSVTLREDEVSFGLGWPGAGFANYTLSLEKTGGATSTPRSLLGLLRLRPEDYKVVGSGVHISDNDAGPADDAWDLTKEDKWKGRLAEMLKAVPWYNPRARLIVLRGIQFLDQAMSVAA